jgi:hypothetical protein
MDEVVDPRSRIAMFLERFGNERNVTLPPLSADGVGSIQRGSAGEAFEDAVHSIAKAADHWDDELA